ncbi:DsrE family protein [Spirosoma areae]
MNNNRYLLTLVWLLLTGAAIYAQSPTGTASKPTDKKMKFLIHITCGPENPTKAALGFLVAKTASDEGHTVSLFLAGDAVTLLKDAEMDKVVGLGTGKLRDHYEAIVKAGGRFYLSGMSSKARNVTDADIAGKPAEFAMPAVLVRLAADSDRMFTY